MKTLITGPWVGELGWELFGWQAYLRHLSRNETYDELIVISRPEHKLFYEDFCSKFIPHTPQTSETDMWGCRGEPPYKKYSEFFNPNSDNKILEPANYLNEKQLFIRFGSSQTSSKFDIIIHARKTDKCGTQYRNWPFKKWQMFVNTFNKFTICSIGTKDGAYHIPGTTDLRNAGLKNLTDILASSKIIIGPSSGPMHLGALCGTHIVSWSPNTGMIRNKYRYETAWNPFNVPVTFIENSWDPSEQEVIEIVRSIL